KWLTTVLLGSQLGELGAQSAANQVKETEPTFVADASRIGLLARYAMEKALYFFQISLIERAKRQICMQALGVRTVCGIGVKNAVMEGTQVAYAYGCLHDCVAGTRRAELLRRLAEKKKPNMVKSDKWIVGESRAVERTRGLVGAGDGTEVPILQSQNKARSPLRIGTIGRTGSRGKKVRLLVPAGDEGREQQSNGKVESRTSASVP
ncbi:MAG: hypothetical protein Q9214_006387, partial [Letrouitia sp. 1 TL-2023]